MADHLDSEAALASASKRLTFTQLRRASTDSVFEEAGAGVFTSGAASSCGSSSSALSFPTVDAVDAPAMTLATQTTDLPWSPDKPVSDKPLAKLILDQHHRASNAVQNVFSLLGLQRRFVHIFQCQFFSASALSQPCSVVL